jgi:hypothetical protein
VPVGSASRPLPVFLIGGPAPSFQLESKIMDSMCGKDHSMMKDPPDSKCVTDCVKAGSKYALYDGKAVYILSDQEAPSNAEMAALA